MKQKVVDRVETVLLPVIQEMGLEMVDITYGKEGSQWYLRIFIDRDGGVSLDDCQMASGKIGKILDEIDPIPQAYVLEVSSPGIERPLKKIDDFRRFTGKTVNITTFEPVAGRKSFTGSLKGLRGKEILLEMRGEEVAISLGQVASARLAVEF